MFLNGQQLAGFGVISVYYWLVLMINILTQEQLAEDPPEKDLTTYAISTEKKGESFNALPQYVIA